jgi:hypothetical protein
MERISMTDLQVIKFVIEHDHFVFQMLVITAICLILWQMKEADMADRLRHNMIGWWFWVRRLTMFLKAASLCWAVTYAYNNDWAPWPPFLAFMISFNLYLGSQIAILHGDVNRLRLRERGLAESPQRSSGA